MKKFSIESVAPNQDQQWHELYQLAEGELGFETASRQRELIQNIAEDMSLNVRFEPSKELSNTTFVILKGDYSQREALMNKIIEEDK